MLSLPACERSDNENLVAIVENDACGIDAMQAITGCSVSKGNLILPDLGKHAYTFISLSTGAALRLVQSSDPLTERIDPVISGLRGGVMAGKATPDKIQEFNERQAAITEKILTIPIGALFIEREARSEILEKARISKSVPCAVCGEMVAEHRARVKNEKIVCIPVPESTDGAGNVFLPT